MSPAGCTDSKCLDEQAASEATASILMAALSGANFVHDVGYTESGMTGSLQQLVFCDEMIGMSGHIVRGIRVEEETLAVDAIAEGADKGNFLALDHTARNFRDQFWFPDLLDRRRYGGWADDGKKTMGDRVREKTRKILEEHRAAPLDGHVTEQLDEIVTH